MDAAVSIRPAEKADEPAVRELIVSCGLPLDGLDGIESTVVAVEGERIVGTASLEVYVDGALLRSVAVDPAYRGRRIGHAVTEAAIAMAKSRGIMAVYLLTETAERFFPRFGFIPVRRGNVPAGVRQSVEFRTVCPESARVMKLALN
jgi:amino-acid N-acetyltransferase